MQGVELMLGPTVNNRAVWLEVGGGETRKSGARNFGVPPVYPPFSLYIFTGTLQPVRIEQAAAEEKKRRLHHQRPLKQPELPEARSVIPVIPLRAPTGRLVTPYVPDLF